MKILNKKMTTKQFINYIENLKVRRKIDKIVFHHTSSPVESWQGSGSMLHYWNLYQSRGWKHGPNIFIAPDGIWLFSPITKQGKGAPGEGNKNSIHIEVVGRYFDKAPDQPEISLFIGLVTYMLTQKFGLNSDNIRNHYQYDPYAHETKYITAEWVWVQINKHLKVIEKMVKDNHSFENAWKIHTDTISNMPTQYLNE